MTAPDPRLVLPTLAALQADVTGCRRCPRLVEWRERVATEKRAAFRDETYWGRPIPGWGDPAARLLIVGLAPAAHGGNRTGRIFTGDRSGDWLFASLHRAGFANQPESRHRDDGLALRDCYIAAAVRCAPPDNKPTPDETATCAPYLQREYELLPSVRVIVVLGAFAYRAAARLAGLRPLPAFGHGREVPIAGGRTILCSYHPSQQNTFTGRLTVEMLDAVFGRAKELVAAP
ncbi:MAG: uracil-DNA glycosylase [Dehalococcoidia bacterium]|nr:uracil-DNA glycosylase [Dehalococcoidia bacterium]